MKERIFGSIEPADCCLFSSEIELVFSTPILGSQKMFSTLRFVLNNNLVRHIGIERRDQTASRSAT
jgi:hypothetical protein